MARKFERLAHHGQIADGRLVVDNPRWFRGMLQQYADAPVVVTIERKRNKRSKEQMGYLWGVVYPLISEHTGHSPEDIHDIFKAKYLRRKKVWRGTTMVVLGSTSALTSNEMAEFITNVVLEAGELGISVPPPDKAYQWH